MNQDPLLVEFLRLMEESGAPLSAVANKAGVARQTIVNWRNQKTLRPLVSTIAAAARAIGYKLEFRR